jgi:hypothetical protein
MNLPDNITEVTSINPRDLVLTSIPKMGKGTILGAFTRERNALVFDLEKGGYEFIPARKVSIYETNETTFDIAYIKYIEYRNELLKAKGKYDFLIIDGLSDLDKLSEFGGTILYMNSIIGKNFNRNPKTGEVYPVDSPDYKSVLSLPNGGGYAYTRKWFLDQIDFFSQISPYRIYAAHIQDKYISNNGKEEVSGSEIALTGKLKSIFASKVTSLCKLIAEGDKRYLSFEVDSDNIIAGSRAPHLQGKILISEMKDRELKTYWNNIYKETEKSKKANK